MSEQRYADPSPGRPLRRFVWNPTWIINSVAKIIEDLSEMDLVKKTVLSDSALTTHWEFYEIQ